MKTRSEKKDTEEQEHLAAAPDAVISPFSRPVPIRNLDGEEYPVLAPESPAAQLILDLYETNPEGAVERFVRISSDRASVAAVLRFLMDKRLPEVVITLTDGLAINDRTLEAIVIERARALTQVQSVQAAARFLAPLARGRKGDYGFQYSAGKMLVEARAPHIALPYFEAAIALKPTPASADRIFMCHMELGQYKDAAAALGRILEIGDYRDSLRREFASLLMNLKPGELDHTLARAMSEKFADDALIGSALLPHLVNSDLLDAAAAIVETERCDFKSWDEDTILYVASYFERNEMSDIVLSIATQCGSASEVVADYFSGILASVSAIELKEFLRSNLGTIGSASRSATSISYLSVVERLTELGDEAGALEMLLRLPKIIGPSEGEFYQRHKLRIGEIVASIASGLGEDLEVRRSLAEFMTFWAEPWVKRFYAGPQIRELARAIEGSMASERDSSSIRLARLHEGYFEYHLERRSSERVQLLANDFRFCEVAIEYFAALSKRMPVSAIPVGPSLSGRLLRPVLSAGFQRSIDSLMAFAMIRDKPSLKLSDPAAFGDFCWWYLTAFVPAQCIPPSCINPELLTYCNEVLVGDEFCGVNVTRFLELVWSSSETYRKKFDLSNMVDRVLFVADLVASLLSRNTQYLPLFRKILALDDNKKNEFLPLCFATLAGETPGLVRPGSKLSAGTVLISALSGTPCDRDTQVASGAPQDVLVIGHAGKNTGLGRNYRMLMNGLRGEGISVTGIDFELDSQEFTREVENWRGRCRSHPIAVLAVNAQDVPEVYAKDLSGALADCHSVGFFLWETSRAPHIQWLGASLVDEVWSPTRYVADVYSPLAKTHVVGKGLYRGAEHLHSADRPETPDPMTFLCAFDFDSSIERKNPLATVLAFQEAFRSDENVRLTIKASTVNARHWSNALGHWERLCDACGRDRRIQLITSRYSDAQMVQLIAKASCLVSLHRAEGFGYLISDAMAYGTPVIATNYSGNVDFCTEETSFQVAYRLIPVDSRAAFWKPEGAEWAEPDISSAAAQMRRVYEDYRGALEVADRANKKIMAEYSVDHFRSTLRSRIDAIREGGKQSIASGSC